MTSPTFVLIYAQGCPACAEAKPAFAKVCAELPSWTTRLVDIDKPGLNLDFPVSVTPTLFCKIGERRYSADPMSLKANLTATTMRKWLENCAADYKSKAGT